jgi:hypothetical protein
VAFSRLGLLDQPVGQMQDAVHQVLGRALAQRHLEHRVVHVVARPRGVERPAQVGPSLRRSSASTRKK